MRKTSQLLDRTGNRTHTVSDVELYHLRAFPIPLVGDLSCDACRTINRNGLLFQTDAADLEVSVAQPITERIERRSLLKKIPPPGGGLVVIECRNMSFRPGKADRQCPPGGCMAEEHLGNRAARPPADIPALQDRIGLLLQQADIERPSVEE